MSVGFGRQPGGPPRGVPTADDPLPRLMVEPLGEVDELTLGPPAFDMPVDQGRDPGRIIAAVFEARHPLEQPRRDRLLGDDADDAAHQTFFRCRARISAARPGLSTCRPRAIDRASAGTSRVMALP